MADETFVYVIAVAGQDASCCKVGMSKSPRKRLSSLQRESSAVLCLAETISATADVAKAIERYAHWLLREHHIRGEWFNARTGLALQAIKEAQRAVLQGHEAPFRIAGAGRPHLEPTVRTVATMVRVHTSVRDQIKKRVGEQNMAAFIRAAVEEKLDREEPHPSRPNPKGEGE